MNKLFLKHFLNFSMFWWSNSPTPEGGVDSKFLSTWRVNRVYAEDDRVVYFDVLNLYLSTQSTFIYSLVLSG